jgi:hypothetical protein
VAWNKRFRKENPSQISQTIYKISKRRGQHCCLFLPQRENADITLAKELHVSTNKQKSCIAVTVYNSLKVEKNFFLTPKKTQKPAMVLQNDLRMCLNKENLRVHTANQIFCLFFAFKNPSNYFVLLCYRTWK